MKKEELYKDLFDRLGFESIETKFFQNGFIILAEKGPYTVSMTVYNEKIVFIQTIYHNEERKEQASIMSTPELISIYITIENPRTHLNFSRYFKETHEIVNIEDFLNQFISKPIDTTKQLLTTMWEA
jgi:hypothetical protein